MSKRALRIMANKKPMESCTSLFIKCTILAIYSLYIFQSFYIFMVIYRVIYEELPPLTELINETILNRKRHMNLDPILNSYGVIRIIANAVL